MRLDRALQRGAHDRPKRDSVHPDAVRGENHGHGARKLIERRGTHRVGEQFGLRPTRGDGREVDDRAHRLGLFVAGGLLDHPLGEHLREPQRGHQVLVEKCRHGVVIGVERIGGHHLAGGVYENVDPVELVDSCRKEVGDGELFAEIAHEIGGRHILVAAVRAQF